MAETDGRGLSLDDCVNEVCPWSGDPVSADSLTLYQGKVVGFCNPGCRDKFERATRAFDQQIGAPNAQAGN
ncbi:MAG: glutathione S-transferase [Pseudomonadota bacterium]